MLIMALDAAARDSSHDHNNAQNALRTQISSPEYAITRGKDCAELLTIRDACHPYENSLRPQFCGDSKFFADNPIKSNFIAPFGTADLLCGV
jgi:hypothetical protein